MEWMTMQQFNYLFYKIKTLDGTEEAFFIVLNMYAYALVYTNNPAAILVWKEEPLRNLTSYLIQ
jgi:hypothetical protein